MIKEEQLDDTVFHFHSALFKLVYGVPLEFAFFLNGNIIFKIPPHPL